MQTYIVFTDFLAYLWARFLQILQNRQHPNLLYIPLARLDEPNDSGLTPLHQALLEENTAFAKALLQVGAWVNEELVLALLENPSAFALLAKLDPQCVSKLLNRLVDHEFDRVLTKKEVDGQKFARMLELGGSHLGFKLTPRQLTELIEATAEGRVSGTHLQNVFLYGSYTAEDFQAHYLWDTVWVYRPNEALLCSLYQAGFPPCILPNNEHPLLRCAHLGYADLARLITSRLAEPVTEALLAEVASVDAAPNRAITRHLSSLLATSAKAA